MIIVYGSEKGGSGKTTLAVEHAIWAYDRGMKVAVIDADRQNQAAHWLSKAEPKITVRQVATTAEMKRALTALEKSHDLVIVDVPGKLEKESIVVLDVADVALVPVMASPLDLRSAMVWSKNVLSAVLRRHPGRPIVRFVLNGLDRRTNVAREIREFSKRMSPPAAKSCIRRLSDFVNAADKSSVSRMGFATRRARADVGKLFTEVMQLAEKGAPAKHTRRKAANE